MSVFKSPRLIIPFIDLPTTVKNREVRHLDKFDKINLEGRVELHLNNNADYSIEIKTSKASDITDLVTEIRNGELFIYNDKTKGKTPKYIIYLNHSGISQLTISGIIKLFSNKAISDKNLKVVGKGVLKGNIKVSVDKLRTEVKGISNIRISGKADVASIEIGGVGKINAKTLEISRGNKRTYGITTVLMPHN